MPHYFFSIYRNMLSKSLVIDAATNLFQVGILEKDRFVEYYCSRNSTLVGFFSLLRSVFKADFREVIFCRGPGKLIGIRGTLMFLRILKVMQPAIKIYAYDTFSLACGILKMDMRETIPQKVRMRWKKSSDCNMGRPVIRRFKTILYLKVRFVCAKAAHSIIGIKVEKLPLYGAMN
jgi:hypothetical protein